MLGGGSGFSNAFLFNGQVWDDAVGGGAGAGITDVDTFLRGELPFRYTGATYADRKSLLRRQRDCAARLRFHRAPRPDARRRSDRDPFLWHLPLGPAHETIGCVTHVGAAVTGFQEDERVGVGCLVDSDGTCPQCLAARSLPITARTDTWEASPTAATPRASSWISGSSCASPSDSKRADALRLGADVEVIAIQQINEAYERMLRSDVKCRFSIDLASLTAS